MRHLRTLILALAVAISLTTIAVNSEAVQPDDPNEPNNDRGMATAIQLPYSEQNLLIAPSGDRDFFQFRLEDLAQVEIAVIADQAGSTLDPVLTLFDGTGEEINLSDDVRGLDPVILAELEAGTYFVEVRGFFDLSVGFYDLEIFALSLGDCIESELDTSETESWSLGELDPGIRIQVLLTGPSGTDFDLALLEVISESPHVIAVVDSSVSLSSQERVTFLVQGDSPREFLVQANAFAGSGPYSICVSTDALGN